MIRASTAADFDDVCAVINDAASRQAIFVVQYDPGTFWIAYDVGEHRVSFGTVSSSPAAALVCSR